MENDTMDELPGPLRFSVASHINGETIKSVPFLCACDESTKQVLVLALQPRVFIPSDCIIQEGERGTEMFFLERGRIIVSTSQVNVPLLTLSTRGDFFGECCLIDSSPTCVTAKACTYCECFVLSKEDFKDALEGSLNLDAVKDDIENTINQIKLRNERIALNFTHPKCSRLMIGQMSEATTEFPKSSTPALLLPGSRFLLIWDSFLLTICIFIAWVIPFRLAFKVSTEVVLVDWALDTFFLLDMLLHFRYVAFIQDGKLVTDVDKIKHHYLSKRFKIDLISTFPFDLVAFLILPKRFILVVEGLRVLKLIRLGRHFQTLEKIFRVLLDRGINLAPLRLIEFLSGVVLIAHWAGKHPFSISLQYLSWILSFFCDSSLSMAWKHVDSLHLHVGKTIKPIVLA